MDYTASKTKSARPGWSISFRHPLRPDARGKPGLKMRRGLNTTDEGVADARVAEMREILADSSWWNASRRKEAELKFSEPVVRAFFDEIQAGVVSSEALREAHLRLPTKADGYSRVLFVGTTGAGKTSLVRQMIGSDPKTDRFPSTAPAKTTIADIELIQAEGPFKAVVTFFSEFQTQANIEECVLDACFASKDRQPSNKIAERLLNHRDQRFRLSYVLGSLSQEGDDEDDFSFDSDLDVVDVEAVISEPERQKNRQVVEEFVERVSSLARSVEEKLSKEILIDVSTASPADRKAAEELVEENFEAELNGSEIFHELVQDILERVQERFGEISSGEIVFRKSGWPEYWTFESEDRDNFIEQLRWFSSNHWSQFGKLLTPLVDGIRARGPLLPAFADRPTKLVLIDGQGLGHTADSSASVTTHVTRRFGAVDLILLVDNAQQPMQAAPLAVLRALLSGGYDRKLAIAFTHFDQIKGVSLKSFAEKRSHVMASVLNALGSLKDDLGAPIIRSIESHIDGRCFMLGGVDKNLDQLPEKAADFMKAQLNSLIELCQMAILPPPPPAARPYYDPTGLMFAVQDAVNKFQKPWLARLGLGTHQGVSKEHWTRVKALSRRLAGEINVEYDTLKPVADFESRLREAISRFLDRPHDWTRPPVNEEEEQAAISEVRRSVAVALQSLALRRVIDDQLIEWRAVYDGPRYRGTGSAFRRAQSISGIYETAAPLPDAVMTADATAFLGEVRELVISAIRISGGDVRLPDLVH